MGHQEEYERLRTKHQLAELERNGVRSRYADVLRPLQSPEKALASVEAEFLSEMASSLGRAEERLCRALVETESLALELDQGAAPPDARGALLKRYNDARDEAQRRLDMLRMQREACGFYRNEVLDEFYPVPPRRSA